MVKVGGVYRHYKGPLYKVMFLGKHTETEEELVIYHAILSPEKTWVRPLAMFEEFVEIEGKKIKRFELQEDQ